MECLPSKGAVSERQMLGKPENTMIEIRPLAPSDPRARRLVRMLDSLQGSLYPAESNHLDSVDTLESENVTFLAAFIDGEVVGCGAVKRVSSSRASPQYGEIKRMYVDPGARGRGVGNALMDALESTLVAHEICIARLETGVHQPVALALYERRGYVRIPPFGEYGEDPLSVFYEKQLA